MYLSKFYTGVLIRNILLLLGYGTYMGTFWVIKIQKWITQEEKYQYEFTDIEVLYLVYNCIFNLI